MSATSSTPAAPTFVSAREAGSILAVDPKTVRRWAQQGRLTAFHFGPRSTRFAVDELLALVESSVCEPDDRGDST